MTKQTFILNCTKVSFVFYKQFIQNKSLYCIMEKLRLF